MCRDALAEELVLLAAPRQGAGRTLDDPRAGDPLSLPELLERQVDLDATGQDVPVVESVLLPVGRVHLAEHEVAAEDVVHDESGDIAVSPGGVVRMPGSPGHVVGGARVGGPAGAQCLVDTIERPYGHGLQGAGG